MKIKITEPGWRGFSDVMGGVPFDKGVSTRDVTQAEADALSAVVRVELVDAKAGEYGVAERLVKHHQARANVEEARKRATKEELAAEVEKRKQEQAERVKKVAGRLYTQEQLEKIADEEGINGLREIGKKFGVTDRSIAGLIREILQAQKEA